ncbi:hypothetical protein K450DRAFT_233176 [Umbelopsis ramanniana AG]|uniref:1-phosphatidylinositol 4-kinase n=1 Tax=Umbelopsis ramanniana AG TaxID=1314678 RepID=A0AAD5EFQ7_UMBRA|nr:uncharacterized protein K450DRAFT_233176 [Umbelopsis ramanniana AG]KAI8581455.1 hypothetical protein K450DRAFT_233176 [Umbelopsis ramanniana AG]
MNSLDFDLHARILSKLAETLADSRAKTTNDELARLKQKCTPLTSDNLDQTLRKQNGNSAIVVTYRGQQGIKSLAKFASAASPEIQRETLPTLISYLRHLPAYEWEHIVKAKGPLPQESLTYVLVQTLLEIGYKLTDEYESINAALWEYAEVLLRGLESRNVEYTVGFLLPSLAGLSKALQESPYLYRQNQLLHIIQNTQPLIQNETLDHVRYAIDTCISERQSDDYCREIAKKYWDDKQPLSNNRLIYDLLVILRNVTGRMVTGQEPTKGQKALNFTDTCNILADSASKIMRPSSADASEKDQQLSKAMRGVYVMSLGYYEDVKELDNSTSSEIKASSSEAYMAGIMASSLHVAVLASVYLHEVDDILMDHISDCLFHPSVITTQSVIEAALDVATILAVNFNHLTDHVITLLCRYLTAPIKARAADITSTMNADIREHTIKALARSVKAKPEGEMTQTATSTLYALLNEITRNNRESYPAANGAASGASSLFPNGAALEVSGLTDSEREQICVSALSGIIGIAKHLEDDSISGQAFSMLILRRKSLTENTAAALIQQFPGLAVSSSRGVFMDIINLFASLNTERRESKMIADAVIAAQLDLARRLHERPEFYSLYLTNLLALFVEKANSIEPISAKEKKGIKLSLPTELGSLLPVLAALLAHTDFRPHETPVENTVALFRNTWFHLVLHGFTDDAISIPEWYRSLIIIASKTPVLVMESATNYLESDLEYNSVLRSGHISDRDLSKMRQSLINYLPKRSAEIKSFSFAQTVFILAVYHIELMRNKSGDCSFMLRYFMNQGVNSSSLASCLEHVVEVVSGTFISENYTKAVVSCNDDAVRAQLHILLKLCCHRLAKVHHSAIKISDRIVAAFPQIFTDKSLICLLLELVQLLWLSCEAEYRDEYCPVYRFTSIKADVTITLGDSHSYRRDICTRFTDFGRKWLRMAVERAPLEVNGLLQNYLAEFDPLQADMPTDTVHMGRSLALEAGRAASSAQPVIQYAPQVTHTIVDNASEFVDAFTSRRHYRGEMTGLAHFGAINRGVNMQHGDSSLVRREVLMDQTPVVNKILTDILQEVKNNKPVAIGYLHHALYRAAGLLITLPKLDADIIRNIVRIPVQIFSPDSMHIGTAVWDWIVVERPDFETLLMVEMLSMWNWCQRHRRGLFSPVLNCQNPFVSRMTYTPSDKAIRQKNCKVANYLFAPHMTWIYFLSSRFHAISHRNKQLVNMFIRLIQESMQNFHLLSTHPLSRMGRFQLLVLAVRMLQGNRMEALQEYKFRHLLYQTAFNWFTMPARWHYGSRKTSALAEYKVVLNFYNAIANDKPNLNRMVTSSLLKSSNNSIGSGLYSFLSGKTKDDVVKHNAQCKKLLMLFLESELNRMSVWSNPLNTPGHGNSGSFINTVEKSMLVDELWKDTVRLAWEIDPRLAVQMPVRFKNPVIESELRNVIANNTLEAVDDAEALVILLGDKLAPNTRLNLRHLQYWSPVAPITATSYFSPAYSNHPLVLQYAMRALEYYPVDTVFFYVPQVVQALRSDDLGYIERYIMEAGSVSQLFAHQIIWNMKANFFVDADKECLKPDSLKPTLERIIHNLVESFTGEDKAFYQREFKFFGEVTAISGYLKEYIKYGQNEKKPMQKKRLDEEMAKIKVDVGVYLPSNPEGRVIDINRTSGRPLQSHAKAPFMATFKLEKDVEEVGPKKTLVADNGSLSSSEDEDKQTIQVWQGAIFKVGDDCRQDVLALQLIAVFKNIFTSVGLDLYVFPYRVVATAPGCGMIDVIPRSISRDQLGREKVNSMYDYFVAKYGGEDSIEFQQARINFVQSVAAYSVISYLLQIKDRHNGNIMLDEDGHIVHIDFGFIFDIAPGGITFESSPFKLTAEMVQVMGGGSEVQQFKQFSELVLKAYLASRPYADEICHLVSLMLQSGLPCFRGETIKRLRSRFQLEKTERAAADFMSLRIKDSFENQRTVLYDYFQKLTNGIPY